MGKDFQARLRFGFHQGPSDSEHIKMIVMPKESSAAISDGGIRISRRSEYVVSRRRLKLKGNVTSRQTAKAAKRIIGLRFCKGNWAEDDCDPQGWVAGKSPV